MIKPWIRNLVIVVAPLAAALVAYTLHELRQKTAPRYPTHRTPAALAAYFECNRCHTMPGLQEAPVRERNCVGCHQAILAGEYDTEYDTKRTDGWKKHLVHLTLTPDLVGLHQRYRREWLIEFLQHPRVIRPKLGAMMPRLKMSQDDAVMIADLFFSNKKATEPPSSSTRARGDLTHGRELIESKGCATCHQFSGIPPLRQSALPSQIDQTHLHDAIRLAPDLSITRDRMTKDAVAAWLHNPVSISPRTLMPNFGLSPSECLDIAEYIVEVPLAPIVARGIPTVPPILDRVVSFAEVENRVFKKICWHCHSDPRPNQGDGGPGNTGGFGYAGKRLDLGSYQGVMLGVLDGNGSRTSIIAPGPDGVSPVIRHMIARHSEVEGKPVPGVLGMPLGHPPIPMDDIQRVLTWIAQGAKP